MSNNFIHILPQIDNLLKFITPLLVLIVIGLLLGIFIASNTQKVKQ